MIDEEDFAPENMDEDFFDEGAEGEGENFLDGVNLEDISGALDDATNQVEHEKIVKKVAIKKNRKFKLKTKFRKRF